MLEPFCPIKHDVYVTIIHISNCETLHRHVSDVNIYSDIKKILNRVFTANNNIYFLYYINSSVKFIKAST